MRRPNRAGAAAVEFAIIAPLFLLLLAGIIEFGQAFHIQHGLSNAARRGARAAITEGATTAAVTQKIKMQCQNVLGVSQSDANVQIAVNNNIGTDVSQAKTGDEITVSVSVPYMKAGVGFFANLFSNSTLTSTFTLERE